MSLRMLYLVFFQLFNLLLLLGRSSVATQLAPLLLVGRMCLDLGVSR